MRAFPSAKLMGCWVLSLVFASWVLSEDFQELEKLALEQHNEYRSWHGISEPLTIDADLTKRAGECAEYYASIHKIDHSCELKGEAGENLYTYKGKKGEGYAVHRGISLWYKEIEKYNFDTHQFSTAVGHFTQLVWKDTKRMGLGVHKDEPTNMVYVVTLYDPPGNMEDEFPNNVLPRTAEGDAGADAQSRNSSSNDKSEEGQDGRSNNRDKGGRKGGRGIAAKDKKPSCDDGLEELECICVSEHNRLRRKHNITKPMTINKDMNKMAAECSQHYMDVAAIDHSCTAKGDHGENLYRYTGTKGLPYAVDRGINLWYKEIEQFSYDTYEFSPNVGHFTQLVWKASERLGLGYVQTPDQKVTYITVLYDPAGNVDGEFPENVLKPLPDDQVPPEPGNGSASQSPSTTPSPVLSTTPSPVLATTPAPLVLSTTPTPLLSTTAAPDNATTTAKPKGGRSIKGSKRPRGAKHAYNCSNKELIKYECIALTEHNRLREVHGIKEPMTVNKEISQKAQECAEYFAGGKNETGTCPSRGAYGQNSYTYKGPKDEAFALNRAIYLWYKENAQYNFDTNEFPENEVRKKHHFPQLIWKASKELGVGVAKSADGNTTSVVVFYSPAGDVEGGHKENVPPPLTSSGDKSTKSTTSAPGTEKPKKKKSKPKGGRGLAKKKPKGSKKPPGGADASANLNKKGNPDSRSEGGDSGEENRTPGAPVDTDGNNKSGGDPGSDDGKKGGQAADGGDGNFFNSTSNDEYTDPGSSGASMEPDEPVDYGSVEQNFHPGGDDDAVLLPKMPPMSPRSTNYYDDADLPEDPHTYRGNSDSLAPLPGMYRTRDNY